MFVLLPSSAFFVLLVSKGAVLLPIYQLLKQQALTSCDVAVEGGVM